MIRDFVTNGDLEEHSKPFKNLSKRQEATAAVSSLRESGIPVDANLNVEKDANLIRMAERALAQRKLFRNSKESTLQKLEEWRSMKFCDLQRNLPGRPQNKATADETKRAEVFQTIRNLIENYSASSSMEKIDVLSALVTDCHDKWKTDTSKINELPL